MQNPPDPMSPGGPGPHPGAAPRLPGPARPRPEADAWVDSPQNMLVVLSMLLSACACCGFFELGPLLVQAGIGLLFAGGILVFVLAALVHLLAVGVLVRAFRTAARSPAGHLHPAFAIPGILFVSYLLIVAACGVLWGLGCAVSINPASDLCGYR